MGSTDHNNGKLGLPGPRNNDYRQGELQAQREREAAAARQRQQQQAAERAAAAHARDMLSIQRGRPHGGGHTGTGARQAGAPASMASMARTGAWLFGGGYALLTLVGDGPTQWPRLVAVSLLLALGGAAAGAALHLAVELGKAVVSAALKLAGALLVIGIVLDLSGVISLTRVVGRLLRVFGLA